jgi:dihydrofolate synthase/folylpolyglutamate synthase
MLLDGAHNPSGAQSLREFLNEFVHLPLTLIFGAMKDKKVDEMGAILFPLAQRLILTEPDNPRAARLGELRSLAETIVNRQILLSADSVRSAVGTASLVTPPDGLICIAGSLYLVGEVKSIMAAPALSELSELSERSGTPQLPDASDSSPQPISS